MKRRASISFGLIIKILILVALISLGFVIYSTCAGTPLIQKIDKTLPDVSTAPYEVTTVTKLYIAQKAYSNEDDSVTMLRWYEKEDDKWIYRAESFTIPPVLNPRINRR